MAPYRIQALTAALFADYGEVIEAHDRNQILSINDGNTERHHNLAQLDPGTDGQIIVSIFRGQPRSLPFTMTIMERHPKASQAFIPLSNQPYLIAVCAADQPLTAQNIQLFLAQGHQGINYKTGVWHHPLMALNHVCDFLVLDRQGPGDNCDIATLAVPITIPAFTD